MIRPELGHHRVEVGDEPSGHPRFVEVVPPGGGEPFIRLNAMSDERVFIFALNAQQARRIARGLLICAERLDFPGAFAGPKDTE